MMYTDKGRAAFMPAYFNVMPLHVRSHPLGHCVHVRWYISWMCDNVMFI